MVKKSLVNLDWIISFFLFIVFFIVILVITITHTTTENNHLDKDVFDHIKDNFNIYFIESFVLININNLPINTKNLSYSILYNLPLYNVQTNNTLVYFSYYNFSENNDIYKKHKSMFDVLSFNNVTNIISINNLTKNTTLKEINIIKINATLNNSFITDLYANTTLLLTSNLQLYFDNNILEKAYYKANERIKDSKIFINNIELSYNQTNYFSNIIASYNLQNPKINLTTYIVAYNNIINYLYSSFNNNLTFFFDLDNFSYLLINNSVIEINYSENRCYDYNNLDYLQLFDSSNSLNIKLFDLNECKLLSNYYFNYCNLSTFFIRICNTNSSILNLTINLNNFSGYSQLFLFFDDIINDSARAIYDFDYTNQYCGTNSLDILSIQKLSDSSISTNLKQSINYDNYEIAIYYNITSVHETSHDKIIFSYKNKNIPQLTDIYLNYYPISLLNESLSNLIPGIMIIKIWR